MTELQTVCTQLDSKLQIKYSISYESTLLSKAQKINIIKLRKNNIMYSKQIESVA